MFMGVGSLGKLDTAGCLQSGCSLTVADPAEPQSLNRRT